LKQVQEQPMKPKRGDDYGEAIEPRIEALDRALGLHSEYLVSPIGFGLGGPPTIAAFPSAIPGALLYCTSEMTGWRSGQKVGKGTQFEFAIAIPAPRRSSAKSRKNSLVNNAWIGNALSVMASFSCDELLRPAETMGPMPQELAPMTRLLSTDFTRYKSPFAFGGKSYGIRLLTLITESEYEHSVAKKSVKALVTKLAEANPFMISDTKRKSVA